MMSGRPRKLDSGFAGPFRPAMTTSGRTWPTATGGTVVCAAAMAGVASSASVQAQAAIERERVRINDKAWLRAASIFARANYSARPLAEMGTLRTATARVAASWRQAVNRAYGTNPTCA